MLWPPPLRLMFLKFRYRLGYELLCRDVADSITWRRFCDDSLRGLARDFGVNVA